MQNHVQPARFALVGLVGAVLVGCGGSGSSDAAFMRVSPDQGPVSGGNQVTVEVGLELGASPMVLFDARPASIVSVGSQSLVVLAPARASTGKVDVRVSAGSTTVRGQGVYTYVANASVTPGATPGTAPVGSGSTAPVGSQPGTTPPGGTPGTPGTIPAGQFAFLANTDKWYVVTDDLSMCDADRDGSPDLLQVLSFVRDTTGGQGAYAGRLADATTLIMSHASQYYLNNPDGTRAVGGIPITFQKTRPTSGTSPAAGRQARPTTREGYNVMAFQHLGGTSSTTGRGLTDVGTQNANLENNSGRGSTGNGLGSFPDREVDFWNRSGTANSQRTLDAFCRVMAATMAHECGHSLGIDHTTAPVRAPAQVNIMAPSSVIDPTKVYAFDEQVIRDLVGFMPGANRCVHAAGWTARWLVQESTGIVIATPRTLADGSLTLDVHSVLSGQLAAQPTAIEGFTQGASLSQAELASIGRSVWFLEGGTAGQYRFGGAEAELIPLAGRDEAEWTTLLQDYRALRALESDRAAWLAAYAARLERSLRSADARIKNGALVELSVEQDAARALSPAAAKLVLAVAASQQDDDVRLMALQALVHRADRALAGSVLELALGTDSPSLLASAAGVLEMTNGLEAAAAPVLARLETTRDAAVRSRAVVVLGWLQAQGALDLATADLAGTPQAARRAAAALGRIGSVDALDALKAVALDLRHEELTRHHALRAIGQIAFRHGGDAYGWLDQQAQLGNEQASFARDFPGSWVLAE